MNLGKLYKLWHENWEYDRLKHDLGPVNKEAWHEYVNSFTVAEVIEHLIECEDWLDD